jgi:GMP synthase-like glutamine amidotransferase
VDPQVLELPAGAMLLASSPRCPVEAYAIESHVLCFQGHPELDAEMVVLLTDPRRGLMSEEDWRLRAESLASSSPHAEEHQKLMRRACLSFLKQD